MGARVGRALAAKIRSLDTTRLVTEAVSGLLVGGAELFAQLAENRQRGATEPDEETGVNTAMTQLADRLNDLMTAPVVAQNSAQTASYLDVVGYNYMETRFAMDGELYPNRVIVGSETHPPAIDTGWAAVRRHAHVIGDFTWTGWDYLGEAGIGRTVYGHDPSTPGIQSFLGEYPWRTAWCGDIDITGHRRPQSFYREIVFGRRADPYLAVQRPEHHGNVGTGTPWSWGDVVSSWSWAGHEGAPVTVEVYADADEVELLVNGHSVGRQPAGAAHRFRSAFETTYEPGLLEAVAWCDGSERGRMAIRSAKEDVLLDADVDRPVIAAHPGDLAFVALKPGRRGRHRPRAARPSRRRAGQRARGAAGPGQREPRHRGRLRGDELHHLRRACPGHRTADRPGADHPPRHGTRLRPATGRDRCPLLSCERVGCDLGAPLASVSRPVGPLHVTSGRPALDRRDGSPGGTTDPRRQRARRPSGRGCTARIPTTGGSTCSRTTSRCSRPTRRCPSPRTTSTGHGEPPGPPRSSATTTTPHAPWPTSPTTRWRPSSPPGAVARRYCRGGTTWRMSSSSRIAAPWSAPRIRTPTVRSMPAHWCTPPWPVRRRWRASIYQRTGRSLLAEVDRPGGGRGPHRLRG